MIRDVDDQWYLGFRRQREMHSSCSTLFRPLPGLLGRLRGPYGFPLHHGRGSAMVGKRHALQLVVRTGELGRLASLPVVDVHRSLSLL